MRREFKTVALVKHLEKEWIPQRSVKSEKMLDRVLRDHVRTWIKDQVPEVPERELKRWVAGHQEEKAEKKWWTQSKERQVVNLWGAGKTSDLFIYHPDGAFGLPRGGISLEIKYIGLNRKTGRTQSYAGAIATTAGQLLAYSIRHDWTIGFVWIDGPQRRSTQKSERHVERSEKLLKRLPHNATLIVRFRE